MTLSRQLILTGLIVLFGLFLGMMAYTLKNTQQFLNTQLSEHAQETANVLGLSLSTSMQKQDLLFASSMIDSIWDAGYYKQIKLEGIDGKLWVNKQQDLKLEGVPSWFVNTLLLKTYPKSAVVQSGWLQVGHIEVESNAAFAYKQIWQTMLDSIIWLGCMALIASILGSFLLYIILKPLRAITKQANELCHQHFSIVEPLPRTLDLRKVVEAMNTMSGRLKAIFEENAKHSLELQNQAYKSLITGLGNRRYFDLQLTQLLQNKEEASGILALIEVSEFKALNELKGYKIGDEFLKEITRFIVARTQSIEEAVSAHLGGAHFAILLIRKTKENAERVAQAIIEDFMKLKKDYPNQNLGVGLCLITPKSTSSELLAQADTAVRKALFQGQTGWYFNEIGAEQDNTLNASQWVAFFKEVIGKRVIILYTQVFNVFNEENKSHQYVEVLLRLKDKKGVLLSAGAFLPMAERLCLMPELDKLVLSAVIDKIKKEESIFYSVNISPICLESSEFIAWTLDKIASLKDLAQYLIIELPEYSVVARLNSIRDFFNKLAQLGCKTAIDHYGKGFSSFAYLQSLPLYFLKIDGSYIADIEHSKENQFFVHSLINIAHTLGIKVIAEAVETQSELDKVIELKADGAQGYFIAHPRPEDR